jgi:SAM-dependent MidA family methyltransferase
MELSAGFRRVAPASLDDLGEERSLVEQVRAAIAAEGPLTFARFMEIALYDPDAGYYRSAQPRPGRRGDFLTAPEAHPIFGHALARQLTEAWQRLDRPDRFVVREHGAGTGALAEAVLRGLAADGSALREVVRFQPIEVEPRRLDALAARLDEAGFGDAVEGADSRPITGVVLANEVLDALPVHRVGIREGRLVERFVGLDPVSGSFADAWGEPSTPALAARLATGKVTLSEGQDAEICLALDGWVAAAAASLARGLLLVIDYGEPAGTLYDNARRPHGSLRAYARHRVHDDVLAHLGRQDLTAHVDLSALDAAARGAGLDPVGSTTQSAFLAGNGIEELLRAVQADPATSLRDYVELRSALMRLLDPAAMGKFAVVAFGRDWPEGPPLAGFAWHVPPRSAQPSTPDYG